MAYSNYSNAGYRYATSGGVKSNGVGGNSIATTKVMPSPRTGGGTMTVRYEPNHYAWATGNGDSAKDLASQVVAQKTRSSGGKGSSKSDLKISGGGGGFDISGLEGAAQAAYDRSMALVMDNYNEALNNLNANYAASRKQMNNNYKRSNKNINADAENAMRQAYVNNMLSRRDLQQAMSAQGLNGGATETTRASMENNYGNARNGIDKTRNNNLAEIENTYQNNLLALEQQMNNAKNELSAQKMQYSMQINNALQDMLSNYYDKIIANMDNEAKAQAYYNSATDAFNRYNGGGGSAAIVPAMNTYNSALQSLGLASNNYGTGSEAQSVSNTYNPVTYQQNGVAADSNYARLAQQQAAQQAAQGAQNSVLANNAYNQALAQMLSQLYGG